MNQEKKKKNIYIYKIKKLLIFHYLNYCIIPVKGLVPIGLLNKRINGSGL